MSIVVKISGDYSTFTDQLIDPSDLKYTEELKSTGELSFTIDINHPQLSSFTEYKKISFYEISGSNDILIWSGIVWNIEYDFNTARVICVDEKRYLGKKIIYTDKTWSAISISTILTELVNESNARSGESLSFTTTLIDTITKTFKKGTKYLDILNEIADLIDAEWTVSLNNLKIETTIGKDRTVSGDDFTEFVSNLTSPNENNISGFKINRNGDQIATAIIGKDSLGTSEAQDLTTVFGRVEEAVAFNDGDRSAQTTSYLDEHKVTQREIDIVPNLILYNYKNINIGDLVKVRVEHNNTFLDINDSFKIVQKIVSFDNGKPNISIKLSKVAKTVVSAENAFGEMNERINRLDLI